MCVGGGTCVRYGFDKQFWNLNRAWKKVIVPSSYLDEAVTVMNLIEFSDFDLIFIYVSIANFLYLRWMRLTNCLNMYSTPSDQITGRQAEHN